LLNYTTCYKLYLKFFERWQNRKKQIWVINVGGYGSLMFDGNETEAE